MTDPFLNRYVSGLLRVAYRLESKLGKSIPYKINEKLQQKAIIQGQFEKQLGIHVDMSKQGPENTNDGNTARIFFRNAEKSA